MMFAMFLVKVTIALSLGLVTVRIARGSRASLRHAILTATFGVLLLLPASLARMPRLEIPIKSLAPAVAELPGAAPAYHFDGRTPTAIPTWLSAPPASTPLSLSTLLFAVWLTGFLFTCVPLAVGIRRSRILR
ncbi:MAG TPA: hypothetical protein VHC90_07895, partial [Bryobacteraceae bacterium]|nr:hypothetical protein [Bryobacteraceae bacterium]